MWRVTEALEYGLVGVNEGLVSTEVSSVLNVATINKGRLKIG